MCCMIHLYKIQKQAKQIISDKNHQVITGVGWGSKMILKVFDENLILIFYSFFWVVITQMCTIAKTPNSTLKMCVQFTIYKFLNINLKQGENSYSGGICFQLFTDLSDLLNSVIWGHLIYSGLGAWLWNLS